MLVRTAPRISNRESDMSTVDGDEHSYQVVVNDEQQYSIWRADRDRPAGWHAEGRTGGKQECLDHIGEVWTDMRPLSLRLRMTQAGAGS
jgi:MbtH protein